MKIPKHHRIRILKAIAKNYIINSKDGHIKYISRYTDLIQEWNSSDMGFRSFCMQIRGRGQVWADAVDYVLENSRWWD